jgi:hypothetical protein
MGLVHAEIELVNLDDKALFRNGYNRKSGQEGKSYCHG